MDNAEDALDFYKVLAPPLTQVSVTLSDVTGSASLYLTTFGAAPSTEEGVSANDSPAARGIVIQVPGSRELLLAVGTLDGLPAGYRLKVVAACNEDPAADGSLTKRQVGADGSLTSGLLGGSDEQDWYTLQLPDRRRGPLLVFPKRQ